MGREPPHGSVSEVIEGPVACVLIIARSKHDSRPTGARTEAPSAFSYHGNPEDSLDHGISWDQAQSSQQSNYLLSPHGNEGDIVAEQGGWSSPITSNHFPGSLQLSDIRSFGTGQTQAQMPDLSFQMPPSGGPVQMAHFGTPTIQVTDPSRIVHSQDMEPHDWSQSTIEAQSSSSAGQDVREPVSGHSCSTCGKVVNRACDLRYACNCTAFHLCFD